MQTRKIAKVFRSKQTLEGAGVRLKRAFGYQEAPLFDPFLLLDHFQSSNPDDYRKGFPWHPHRGIETFTYLIEGKVEHQDSLGNQGTISAGDLQWMTAGSGIIHQEMPQGNPLGIIQGFQLWINLPAAQKMTVPRYQDIKANQIPEIILQSGAQLKIISGEAHQFLGPVKDIVIEPDIFDVTIPTGATFVHHLEPGSTALAYIIRGEGVFDGGHGFGNHLPGQSLFGPDTLILYGPTGDSVLVKAMAQPVRFLFLSGNPLGEPIAWQGPIVKNTQSELQTAFQEYQNGTFIKNTVPNGLRARHSIKI